MNIDTSGELRHVRTVANEKMELGANAIDLTLISNQHGDRSDAELTAAHIAPDSLVFMEGHPDFNEESINEVDPFMLLNVLRLRKGKGSTDYITLKDQLSKAVDLSVSTSSYVFSEHDVLLKHLLEKDCSIHTADYTRTDEETDILMAEASRSAYDVGYEGMSVGEIARKIQKKVRDKSWYHNIREASAVRYVLLGSGAYSQGVGGVVGMNITEEGKLRTYLTFGVAHERSLSEKFRQQGVNTEIVPVVELPEWQYFEKSRDDFKRNFKRRVAHEALQRSGAHTKVDDPDALLEESYEMLDAVNNDPQKYAQFVTQCIQARLAREEDIRSGIDDYSDNTERIIRGAFHSLANMTR